MAHNCLRLVIAWLLIRLPIWAFIFWWNLDPVKVPHHIPVKKEWLKKNEFGRILLLLISLFGVDKHRGTLLLGPLRKFVVRVWKFPSDAKFLSKYLAEVLRFSYDFINCKYRPSKEVWIKMNGFGLPKCLGPYGSWLLTLVMVVNNHPKTPFKECLAIANKGIKPFIKAKRLQEFSDGVKWLQVLMQVRVLISAISTFRAMGWKEDKIKWHTVTNPFTGKFQTVARKDLQKALVKLGITRLEIRKPSLFRRTMKSGPMTINASMGVIADLCAIITNRKWLVMTDYIVTNRFYQVGVAWFLLSLLVLPLVCLVLFFKLDLSIGRLAVVPEARGKNRIVGITDWWTQTLFKPLHDEIYKKLSNIPMDGTADQLAPIKLLLESHLNLGNIPLGKESMESLDLSAATDRLPIKIQMDILNELGICGGLWKEILTRTWDCPDGIKRSYAVGQPMGAYSSFAMLALTNHVIVQISAGYNQSNDDLTRFENYAVLGDDVFIWDTVISKWYFSLLEGLGVEINPIKGFSGQILEFAKNVFTKSGINLSPLGAKNLLLAVRYPLFINSVIFDAINKDFDVLDWVSYETVQTAFFNLYYRTTGNKKKSVYTYGHRLKIRILILACFGPSSGLWVQRDGPLNRKTLIWLQKIFESALNTGKPGRYIGLVRDVVESRISNSISSIYDGDLKGALYTLFKGVALRQDSKFSSELREFNDSALKEYLCGLLGIHLDPHSGTLRPYNILGRISYINHLLITRRVNGKDIILVKPGRYSLNMWYYVPLLYWVQALGRFWSFFNFVTVAVFTPILIVAVWFIEIRKKARVVMLWLASSFFNLSWPSLSILKNIMDSGVGYTRPETRGFWEWWTLLNSGTEGLYRLWRSTASRSQNPLTVDDPDVIEISQADFFKDIINPIKWALWIKDIKDVPPMLFLSENAKKMDTTRMSKGLKAFDFLRLIRKILAICDPRVREHLLKLSEEIKIQNLPESEREDMRTKFQLATILRKAKAFSKRQRQVDKAFGRTLDNITLNRTGNSIRLAGIKRKGEN